MTYPQFVSLYGDLIYEEWVNEDVWDELGVPYDTYLKWKYEGYMELQNALENEDDNEEPAAD